MLTWFHCYFGLREDLVDVSVEDYVVDAAAVAHEAVPGLGIEECVVDYNGCVGGSGSHISPAIIVEFPY